MQSTGNTLPGLVSTNPFLKSPAPTTGGTTTSAFAPTNTTTSSLPGQTNFNAPVPQSINFGAAAASTAPATASSPAPVSGGTTSGYSGGKLMVDPVTGNKYQIVNGTMQSYSGPSYQGADGMYSGIAPATSNQANNSQPSLPAGTSAPVINNTGTSGGSGTGGGQAPAGSMYDGQGNIVPNMNSPQNSNQANGSTFGNAVGTLAQTASQTNPAYDQAVKDYQTAQQQLKESRTNEANSLALNSENPIPLEFQQGRGQIIQNQYLSQQDALTNQMTAAQGLGQIGTAQQGTQQSGLNLAAGLVSPTLGQYGQAQYSPLGGTVGGGTGAGVSPSDPFYQTMQTYAQALASGQGTAIPSSITGNPALQAQLLNMAKQINPNFNYNQSTATGQSQQSQTQQAQQYQSASQQAQNLGLQLNQLIQAGGINPSDINAMNTAFQKLASNTSNPNYGTFQDLIADLANTYAQVLTPAGGSTTDMVRQISSSLLDSSMKGSGITQVMQNLDAQVKAKIAGVQTAYGTTNSNTTPSGANPWH